MDSRWLQLLFLFSFLLAGLYWRDFSIRKSSILVLPAAALLTQAFFIYFLKLKRNSLLSALITSFGILLICRATSDLYLCLGTVLAIASKFIFVSGKKHFFNPANFGIVFLTSIGFPVWTSPSQWGEGALLLLWLGCLGLTIVHHASRYDVSFFFLGCYALLLLARISYLGQPLAVFFHQLQSGTLILFTFFMISDPRSIPDHRMGRFILAFFVALCAYGLRFYLFNPNALLYSLFFLSPFTLLIDKFFVSSRYEWNRKREVLV